MRATSVLPYAPALAAACSTCVAVEACATLGEELEINTAVSSESTRAVTLADLRTPPEREDASGALSRPSRPALISMLDDSRKLELGRTWCYHATTHRVSGRPRRSHTLARPPLRAGSKRGAERVLKEARR